MRYSQFRIAKRDGEIVWQRRYAYVGKSYKVLPWWKFWNQEYACDTTYDEWVDLPIKEIGAQS